MNDKAQIIKTALMVALSERGYTLYDLESDLIKSANDADLTKLPGKVIDAVPTMFNIAGGSALALGSLLGLGGYAAYRANDDSTQKKLKKMQEAQQYEEATRALQTNLSRNRL